MNHLLTHTSCYHMYCITHDCNSLFKYKITSYSNSYDPYIIISRSNDYNDDLEKSS